MLALPARRPYVEKVLAELEVPDPEFVKLPTGPTAAVAGMSTGDVLCWKSHVKAMKSFLASDGHRMLVFEDDIEATVASVKPWLHLMRFVPDSAVVYLGRCWSQCWLDEPVVPGLVRTRRSSCMHALSLSREAAQAYVKIEPYAPSDDILQDLIASGTIDAYAFKPGLFIQNQTLFDTTSGSTRPDKVTLDCKPNYESFAVGGAAAVLIGVIALMMVFIGKLK